MNAFHACMSQFPLPLSLGAIHKGRPRRGWEGGFRNSDKLGHREGGGLIQQPGRPSLKKQKLKTYLFLWNKKIRTVG